MSRSSKVLADAGAIARRIVILRSEKVLLDADLAALYRVSTARFNEQVKRNRDRFPKDFMFRLTYDELKALRSQFAISNGHTGRGGRRYLPFAFTEHGAIMAATILRSPRAVEVSVYVVRAFVQLREMIASNKTLAVKLKVLEKRLERRLDEQDEVIVEILQAIRQLMAPREPKKERSIGFITSEAK